MSSLGYLNEVLKEYEKTFDIERNYIVNGEKTEAYGYFSSHSEKYLLVKEVQLWETKAYEHIFFIERENLTMDDFEKIVFSVPKYTEIQLVRKGNKYPEKNHMYSYITLVILTENILDHEIIEKTERYKFERTYLFSVRGYVQTRIILIDTKNKSIFTNKSGKKLEKVYKYFMNKI